MRAGAERAGTGVGFFALAANGIWEWRAEYGIMNTWI
jgi:hypothetical protein